MLALKFISNDALLYALYFDGYVKTLLCHTESWLHSAGTNRA